MIYVSEEQLSQVEYLLGQSAQGNHVLFEIETLRKIFDGVHETKSVSNSYSVEHHIERLIQQPTIAEKRAYLENLDASTFQWVVRTYFNIVENNIYESQGARH